MNSKNLAIATLSITAVVLFCALAMTGSWPGGQAYGRGMVDRGGNYIVATQSLQDTEVVVIVDGDSNQMNLYRFDPTTRRLQLADRIRLDDQLFGSRIGREQPRGERERGAERDKERDKGGRGKRP